MAWLGKCVSNSNTGDIRKICDERIGIPVMGGGGVGLRGGWVLSKPVKSFWVQQYRRSTGRR